MLTLAPSNQVWWQYVKVDASFVDQCTGLLAGPWAECLCWSMVFERTQDWENMPEYRGEGPVSGILSALREDLMVHEALQPLQDTQLLMAAAEKLMEVAQAAAGEGRPLPVIDLMGRTLDAPVPCQPTCKQPASKTPDGQPENGKAMGSQPMHGQPGQQPYQGQPCGSGPTLLQQRTHGKSGDVGAGGKVALVAFSGVVARASPQTVEL